MTTQQHFTHTYGTTPVVTAPYEIDIATRELFHADLLAASRNHATVIVDFSQTVFCDSSGVNVLMRAWRRAHADNGEIILVHVGRSVARILSVIGIDRLFPAFDSLADAFASGLPGVVAPPELNRSPN